MNRYLSREYEEKELYETLKPHFYDLDLFCDARYNCTRLVNRSLLADEQVIREPEEMLKGIIDVGVRQKLIEYSLNQFMENKVSLTKAAEIGGVSIRKMLDTLNETGISLHISQKC